MRFKKKTKIQTKNVLKYISIAFSLEFVVLPISGLPIFYSRDLHAQCLQDVPINFYIKSFGIVNAIFGVSLTGVE